MTELKVGDKGVLSYHSESYPARVLGFLNSGQLVVAYTSKGLEYAFGFYSGCTHKFVKDPEYVYLNVYGPQIAASPEWSTKEEAEKGRGKSPDCIGVLRMPVDMPERIEFISRGRIEKGDY